MSTTEDNTITQRVIVHELPEENRLRQIEDRLNALETRKETPLTRAAEEGYAQFVIRHYKALVWEFIDGNGDKHYYQSTHDIPIGSGLSPAPGYLIPGELISTRYPGSEDVFQPYDKSQQSYDLSSGRPEPVERQQTFVPLTAMSEAELAELRAKVDARLAELDNKEM